MTTGLREFTGWARLRMLSGLQQNRQLIRTNDAMVAAELKKNFGDGIEMPTKEDDMLVGRDVLMPNPQPIVIMPQQPPQQPASSLPTILAVMLGLILAAILAVGVAFCLWYTFFRVQPTSLTPAPIPAPAPAGSEEWKVKFFTP